MVYHPQDENANHYTTDAVEVQGKPYLKVSQ